MTTEESFIFKKGFTFKEYLKWNEGHLIVCFETLMTMKLMIYIASSVSLGDRPCC